MEQQLATMESPCFVNLPIEIQQHIFSYCGPKTRREITLVCKDWAEKLRYFSEDFRIHLDYCYMQHDLEPVSFLMNSTRRWHSLTLGEEIHIENDAVLKQLLDHLGKHVHELAIGGFELKSSEAPNFLLSFPQLKKLTVDKTDLCSFCWFPETLEHVHLWELEMEEEKDTIEILRKIKNLKILTSETVQMKRINFDAMSSSKTRVFNVDGDLKSLVESLQVWHYTELDCHIKSNLIGTSAISLGDLLGIEIHGALTTFHQFNKFPNLRYLLITWTTTPNQEPFCFNSHQAAVCPTVERLTMSNYKQPCIECFKALIDSFPNVIDLMLKRSDITNQHIKYICYKLPKLNHLETDSCTLNHEIVCNDQPEYLLGNLTQLEYLFMPKSSADNLLARWPFMPHLKWLKFGALLNDLVLINFSKKTPNLEYFSIGEGSLLTHTGIEIIAQNWPNLCRLVLNSSVPCDVSAIKQFCRNLRTLELRMKLNPVHTIASFFDEIPTLNRYANLKNSDIYRFQIECGEWTFD